MKKTFLTELTKLNDVDFITLEHHFNIARMVRNTMSKNGIESNKMAEILNIQPKRMREVVNGSYPFNLMFLATLQAHQMGIASEDAKFKIEAEGVGFTKYKDQYPLYVDRIEKLLSLLEEKHKK